MLKRVFLLLFVACVLTGLGFAYERVILAGQFGPSSMLALGLLLVVGITLLISYLMLDGRYREKVLGFWLILVSTLGSYLAFDLIAGAILIHPLSPELVPDAVRHHKLVPDAHARFDQQDFSYLQRNNSLGLRGKPAELEKSPGSYRILTLGDSFTMGKGVEDDQTFSYRLQTILNRHIKGCDAVYRDIEVLNGGVDSYSPVLSYLYLTRELAPLNPDLVVFNLDISDLVQEAAYRGIAITEDDSIVAVPGSEGEESLSERLRHWIEGHLYLTRLVLYYTNELLGHRDLVVSDVVTRANSEIVAHTLVGDSIDRSDQWENIFESIDAMRQFAENRSMDFIMTIYPWAHQVSETEWQPGRLVFMSDEDEPIKDYDIRLKAMADRKGIELLNLFPAFRHYTGNDPLYFRNDMHFTAQGHELMAESLAQQLLERDFGRKFCE